MILKDEIAVVYGGGGAIGGAAARAFAREGARVFLAGRTRAKLEAVARDITTAGGTAHVAVVDALDEHAVERHAEAIAAEAGRVDIALNAVGVVNVHGKPLAELTLDEYELPIHTYTRTHFLTARAVARHMVPRRHGVILTVSTPGGKLAYPGITGFGTACAAIEGLSRQLAGELGTAGVRVVCLRPDAIPEALAAGSHSRTVFEKVARAAGMTAEEMLEAASATTLLKRFPTLDEVGRTAAFVASREGGALTGTVINLSCGSVVD